jgi:uncharacterized RDD family membrane protein YckC
LSGFASLGTGGEYGVASDLPSYPQEAAEREATQAPPSEARAYASWGRRVGAYLLDVLIIFVPVMVVIVVALIAASPDEDDGAWAVVGFAYLVSLLFPFVYFTVLHGRPSGKTPGKSVLGIRVVSDETGGSISYGRAFGRYAIGFVFGIFVLPLILDYLWPLWDTKNQALHDKVVGSVVVRA